MSNVLYSIGVQSISFFLYTPNKLDMLCAVKIIRPVNSVVSGLTAVIACIISGVYDFSLALLMFFIVTLICGAGNVINDFFDYEIDKINRPKRPIPSGKVSRKYALAESLILFASGISISVFLNNSICIFIAVVNSALLILYAAKFKGVPFLGNISVAYLTGSIFIFGGALSGEFMLVLPLFAITFFGTLAREILKDAEDVEGDKLCGAKTMPIIFGIKKSEILAMIFVVAAVTFSVFPYFTWGLIYLIPISALDAFMIFAVAVSLKCKNPDELRKSKSTSYLKYGMFASLAVFFIAGII